MVVVFACRSKTIWNEKSRVKDTAFRLNYPQELAYDFFNCLHLTTNASAYFSSVFFAAAL
jgi:hypothetical protein